MEFWFGCMDVTSSEFLSPQFYCFLKYQDFSEQLFTVFTFSQLVHGSSKMQHWVWESMFVEHLAMQLLFELYYFFHLHVFIELALQIRKQENLSIREAFKKAMDEV